MMKKRVLSMIMAVLLVCIMCMQVPVLAMDDTKVEFAELPLYEGVKTGIIASFDKETYAKGETATLQISVVNCDWNTVGLAAVYEPDTASLISINSADDTLFAFSSRKMDSDHASFSFTEYVKPSAGKAVTADENGLLVANITFVVENDGRPQLTFTALAGDPDFDSQSYLLLGGGSAVLNSVSPVLTYGPYRDGVYQDQEGNVYVLFANGSPDLRANCTPIINGKKYWKSASGTLRCGWLHLGEWALYFDPETYAAVIGMNEVEGHMYIFNDDGVMRNVPGTPVVNGKKYWFATEGYLKTGWLKLTTWKMYFDPVTYEAAIGKTEVEGHMYLFNSDGVMTTAAGTPVIDGKKYWFASEGYLRSGWLHLGSWNMYFDPVTYEGYVNCTALIDGVYYTFDNNGVVTGEKKAV